MRVFVAGASGAIGRRIVPQLIEKGHDVIGMTRSRPELVRELGAEAVQADALDRRAVEKAVVEARPDVVVHQLTALSGGLTNPRAIGKTFEATNQLRTTGTDNLLAAARAAGVRRFVAQSFAGWPFERKGGPAKTEEDPLDPSPPKAMRSVLDAIRYLEKTVTGVPDLEGVVLRYGGFYGPGTSMSSNGGEHTAALRKRRFPIVGDGGGVWSLIHIDDAASATVAAVEHGPRGIYNVADDRPAPVREWLPVLAEAVGAPPPRHVPLWLARVLAGEPTVVMMTEIRGAANRKAKWELGWKLRYPTWREGFAHGL